MLKLSSAAISYDAALADEIAFWVKQEAEHAAMLELGLTDAQQKATAGTFRNRLSDLSNRLVSIGIPKAHAEAVKVVQEFRAFKVDILTRLQTGWNGWLHATFIDHLIREGDYFLQMITSPEPYPNEARTWIDFLTEHAAFVAHFSDPRASSAIKMASFQITNLERASIACDEQTMQALAIAEAASNGLHQFLMSLPVGTPTYLSNMPSMFHQHFIREGQRFSSVLYRLRTV